LTAKPIASLWPSNLDPRVRVSSADLEAQVDLARMIDAWMNTSFRSYNDVSALRAVLAGARKNSGRKSAIKGSGRCRAGIRQGTP